MAATHIKLHIKGEPAWFPLSGVAIVPVAGKRTAYFMGQTWDIDETREQVREMLGFQGRQVDGKEPGR
jgi:hypothetical protein